MMPDDYVHPQINEVVKKGVWCILTDNFKGFFAYFSYGELPLAKEL